MFHQDCLASYLVHSAPIIVKSTTIPRTMIRPQILTHLDQGIKVKASATLYGYSDFTVKDSTLKISLVFPRTSSIISINSTSSNMSRLSLMAITGSKTSRKREKSLKHQTLPRSNTITQMHSGDGWMNMPHNRPHSMRFKRTTSFGDTRSLGTVPRIVYDQSLLRALQPFYALKVDVPSGCPSSDWSHS